MFILVQIRICKSLDFEFMQIIRKLLLNSFSLHTYGVQTLKTLYLLV